jgi:hypothetical protein
MARARLGILAPACDRKYIERMGDIALFTVSAHFAPSGPVRKNRLVEFVDDPGP